MILGVLHRERQGADLKRDLLRIIPRLSERSESGRAAIWAGDHLAMCSVPLDGDPHTATCRPFVSDDEKTTVMCEGRIHNIEEIDRLIGPDHRLAASCPGEAIGRLYRKNGEDFLDPLNGQFVFALWDGAEEKLLLGRDRLGIVSLFYADQGPRFIFSSSLKALLATGWVAKQLSHESILQYLLYCYNPGQETLVRNVYKLPAGHVLSVRNSSLWTRRYWQLSFAETRLKPEEQYQEEILDLIRDAIRIRVEPDRPTGVFLSGGTDSSTIVSLASRMSPEPLRTFSFRCEGRSYDESPYARFVAGRYGTEHTEVSFGPDDLSLMSKAVEWMDEPFCDVGIEIGTYLLGQAAQGKASYVLSGEGGDELFGGHPVYVADKVAAVVDQLPQAIINPLSRILQGIPDSDQKKNMQVKLKRFAYGLAFPAGLLSHRWRIYYTPAELRELCTEDFLGSCDLECIFEPMVRHAAEADGKDLLSRSLYSDYGTLVDFYLRRLELLRAHGIESRTPLLDHRLVEYAATIPSRLKIRKMSQTKYIYRRVLEGVLPAEILHDRPKLGHSVPMKKWLREDAAGLRECIGDVLGNGAGPARELFRPAAVRRMVDEHLRRTHNHSHRLWGLLVLETWLRRVLGAGAGDGAGSDSMADFHATRGVGVVGQQANADTRRIR